MERLHRHPDARRIACRLCGAPAEFAFEVGDRNRGLGDGSFRYWRCTACNAVFLACVPDDPEFVRREEVKLELVRRFVGDGALVEIGPGPGQFTRVARAAGFDVTVIDRDGEYCGQIHQLLGVRAVQSEDPAEVLPGLPPSAAVAMWHAIEHLADPWGVLGACARNLQPGGVLAISTPNPDSLQFRLLGRYWMHLDAPRHLQLIPAETLRGRAAQLGLRHVLTVTTDPVGLECNRLGWEYALRLHPAIHPTTTATQRGSFLMVRALGGAERR